MRTVFLLALLWVSTPFYSQSRDQKQIEAIFDMALDRGKAYDWLNYLSNQIGGRLSGSVQAEQAVEYTKGQLETLGLDRVWLQAVMVPKWVRGTAEFAYIETKPGVTTNVEICALGGSVPTPILGIKAKVVEVQGIADLENLGREKIQGKIVFFNRAMDPTDLDPFKAYSDRVDQRYSGAAQAAKYGAVGVIVRSLTLRLDDFPHTGSMSYGDTPPSQWIPAAAISTKGAELLSTTLALDPEINFHFRQSCRQYDDVGSHNVIGEIRGSTHPEEIMVVGAHLDSWDLGDGSHDDGAGVVQAMEVLRLLKALDYSPKRTLRVVLYMNEENGLRGGNGYAQRAKEQNENHVFALESDSGGFTPRGFTIEGSKENLAQIRSWAKLFAPYLIHIFDPGYAGADIAPLKDDNTLLVGLRPDAQRYFDHHHSANDTFEHVNKRELELGAAAMTALIYLIDSYGTVPAKG